MSQLQSQHAASLKAMRNEFMAVIERIDGNHVAYSPEIPGVQGQGRTKMAALVDLRAAVARTLNDRRNRAVLAASAGAVFDSINVE